MANHLFKVIEQKQQNVNHMMDYNLNPFLRGMDMWHAWMAMYNEFATLGIRLSLNWFDLLWKLSSPSTAA